MVQIKSLLYYLNLTKQKYSFQLNGNPNIIKIHITKTAGESLSKAMGFRPPKKKHGLKKHYFAREIIDIIGQEEWDRAFKFSIVRNPWDRLFSAYRYKLRTNRIKSEKQKKSFKLWLFSRAEVLKRNPFANIQPQVEWLMDYNEKIDFNFIGRFEKLDEDVTRLGNMLNMKINLPLMNQSLPIIHYSEVYDKESIDFVYNYYKKDIEMFNYKFDDNNPS